LRQQRAKVLASWPSRSPIPILPSASDPSGASIFTTIQEIGLNFEAAKAPLEVLVIDSVQKPSEN